MKEEFSRYSWLSATETAHATHAADVRTRWQRALNAPAYWVCDHGANFVNTLPEKIAQDLTILHIPTIPYSHRSKWLWKG